MIVATDLLSGLIGLVLPGYLLSRILGDRRSAWGTGFVSSIVIMFNVIFWMEVAGFRIVPVRVFAAEIGISLVLAAVWWWRTGRKPSSSIAIPRIWPFAGITMVSACGLMSVASIGAAVLLRAWLWPLSGAD